MCICNRQMMRLTKPFGMMIVALVVAMAAGVTRAEVIQGESSAYGVDVGVHLLDQNNLLNVLVGADLGPIPAVAGSAPSPYSSNNTLADASVSVGSLLNLGGGLIQVNAANHDNTDVLAVNASSDVDGGAGSRHANADATVDNLGVNLNLAGLLGIVLPFNTADILSLDATTIHSEAHVSGDYNNFTAAGDSLIIDVDGTGDGFATLNVLGVNFDIAVDAQGHVAPNTTLNIDAGVSTLLGDLLGADLAGTIQVVLNEQILSGDGVSSRGLTVNAIHISLNDVGAEFLSLAGLSLDDTNLLSGDIIIAQSHAALTAEPSAVPTPAALPAGLALMGVFGLRRRRK